MHGISQDLEPGFPKLVIVKNQTLLGVLFCKGNNIQGTIRNMYPLAENRHDVLLQCHGNCIEVKIIHYLLEIDIFQFRTKNRCPDA